MGEAPVGPNEEDAVQSTGAPGRLVLVATPIGNLGDLSPRARQTLAEADAVYCEDTRRTRVLLSAHDIPSAGRLRSLHAHNESERVDEVLARVARGELVAVVSDAGTPGISDPGARVAAAAAAAGLDLSVVPGPSAALGALVVSGLDTSRFVVEGFVPRRGAERDALIEQWAREPRTIVLFEAPPRLAATLAELAERLGPRRGAVVRELTKIHEEVWRATLPELAERAAAGVRGEVVVVIEGAPPPEAESIDLDDAVRTHLLAGASVRDAAARVAAEHGVAHRDAYAAALRVRGE